MNDGVRLFQGAMTCCCPERQCISVIIDSSGVRFLSSHRDQLDLRARNRRGVSSLDPGPYAKRLTRWRSRFEFIDFISSPVAIFAILSPLHFAPVFAFCLLLTLVAHFCIFPPPPAALRGSFIPSIDDTDRSHIWSLDLRSRRFHFSISISSFDSTRASYKPIQTRPHFQRLSAHVPPASRLIDRSSHPIESNDLRSRPSTQCLAESGAPKRCSASSSCCGFSLFGDEGLDTRQGLTTAGIQGRRCVWKDLTAQRVHKGVSGWMPTYPGLSLEAPPLTGTATSRPSTSPRCSRTTSTVRPRSSPNRKAERSSNQELYRHLCRQCPYRAVSVGYGWAGGV